MAIEPDYPNFDPSWTEQDAVDMVDRDPTFADGPTSPFFRWRAHHKLEQLAGRFAAGDSFALMLAIRVCANHDMPLPDWAVRAYIKAFDKVLNYRSKSWDEVFGRPIPKGKHLAQLKQKRELKIRVWRKFNEIKNAEPGTPTDAELFERIGRELRPDDPIGKTLVSEYYYETNRLMT